MTSQRRLPGKRSAKKRVSWAPLLERRLAGRKFSEGLRAKPLAALECLFARAGGLPFLLHVMPVRMRVAEFFTDQNNQVKRKTDYNLDPQNGGISKLNPNLPVWVVVHGRNDSEEGSNIELLARSLSDAGHQVVTIDWNKTAHSVVLEGANWIEAVGKWTSNQLKANGVKGENIILPNHSWGTLVGYEIAKNYKYGPEGNGFGVQAIIALDTPLNPLGFNKYNEGDAVFSDVSRVSWGLRSSFFGSKKRNGYTNVNFGIEAPNEAAELAIAKSSTDAAARKFVLDAIEAYEGEHGYAVSYFANLINGNGDQSLQALKIQDLIDGKMPNLLVDPYGLEGILPVVLRNARDSQGRNYVQAVPTRLKSIFEE